MKTDIFNIYKRYKNQNGREVLISGWVRTVRVSKSFGFIEVNDGTHFCNVQVVFEQKRLYNFNEVSRLNAGAAISVTGELVLTPDAKQEFEIKAKAIIIEGESSPMYPLQKKRHSLEFLRNVAHLRPRSNTFMAMFRVRSAAAFAIHKFFNERGFVYVHTPIITGSDSEGAGNMFSVTTLDLLNTPKNDKGKVDYKRDFFSKPAHLTVSGQLEGEAFAMAFSKIYTFGPTFRAENSNTARHASEFWMVEPEIAFADLKDNMQLCEQMLKYVVCYVLENCPSEMEFFNNFFDKNLINRLNDMINSEFARVSYTSAVEILKKYQDKFEFEVAWGEDLQSEHERFLTREIYKKPVFVIDYPKKIKAFYMRQNDDNKTVAAMDLLVPGIGEIIGGSQREERLEMLISRMEQLGMNIDDYQWYLDLRRYGTAKHSGFGLGFERLIMYITGVLNIRDTIPFPRTVGWLEF